MDLSERDKEMLSGSRGRAARKAMEILFALGRIYGARRLIDVSSAQVSGVSYENLGEAGLELLEEMASDGRAVVPATLNPAGMDLTDWPRMGIDETFAARQHRVIRAFEQMGIRPTCTCTPYLAGNVPAAGEHVAWGESSAVCYANSILGARTNREGGPSALASALTGRTPEYGLHLDEARRPTVTVEVQTSLRGPADFGALGWVLGRRIGNRIPLLLGLSEASQDEWKSLCASIATYGGTALFHVRGITPEEAPEPRERIRLAAGDIEDAFRSMDDGRVPDLVAIGCPHCSLEELRRLADLLSERRVARETWIATARPVKEAAAAQGLVEKIERTGAKVLADTCFVVAPIRGRFRCMATNSAKAVFYARSKNRFQTVFAPLERLVEIAVGG